MMMMDDNPSVRCPVDCRGSTMTVMTVSFDDVEAMSTSWLTAG